MKTLAVCSLALIAGSLSAGVVIGTPDIPSMDPFCAS